MLLIFLFYQDTYTDLFTTFFISIVPIQIYANSDIQKAGPPQGGRRAAGGGAASILSENRNKSGIYRWINSLTGEFSIGSAPQGGAPPGGERCKSNYSILF